MKQHREKPLAWYPGEHRKDMKGAQHTTVSVWREIIDKMHESKTDRFECTVQRWADWFRVNPINMMGVFQELLELKIADIEHNGKPVNPGTSFFAVHDITLDFGQITVISRRRRKEAKKRAGNRERQRRHQAKKRA